MIKEPFYTQDEFPENMLSTDGMKIIYGRCHIPYVTKGTKHSPSGVFLFSCCPSVYQVDCSCHHFHAIAALS
jgi:hypothetical protein